MKAKILTAFDRLKRAKLAAGEMARTADEWRRHLDTLVEDLRRLEAIAPKGNKLDAMVERIGRLRELLNMMEPGAFSIQIDREMEAVWREING